MGALASAARLCDADGLNRLGAAEAWVMSQGVQELFQAALALTDEEQLQLVAAVDERGLRPFDESWLAEIQRRSAEYDAGTVQPIPWAEVKERARRESLSRG
jgi:putative addiction module component (TIGR02574 family)